MNEIKMPAAFAEIDENEMVYLNGGSITDTEAWKIFLNVGTLFNYVTSTPSRYPADIQEWIVFHYEPPVS